MVNELESKREEMEMYAQVPDVVPLLRLTVVDADTVVALERGELADESTPSAKVVAIAIEEFNSPKSPSSRGPRRRWAGS